MIENDERAQANAILTQALQGNFISGVIIGDWWILSLGGYSLLAQNVLSKDEPFLNQWYQANYPPFADSVDKELISKATIVTAHLRQLIAEVTLDDDCNLILGFENGCQLTLSTDEDIVDWQWALNTSGADPYVDCIIGCFWKGEIQINGEVAPSDNI